MKDLSEVISKQQKLLDDTFKAKREQNAGNDQNQGGQFEVSPPGQPLEFGPGMSMAPLFEVPGDAEPGSEKGQGSSGKQVSPRGSGQAEQGMQPPGPGQHPSQNGQLGDLQEELRDKLQSLTDRLRIDGANPPQEFEGAQEAMKEAKQELGDGNLDSATQSQSLALERLRKGAQSMAEQMMQNGDAQAGQGPGNNGRDPLGRPDRSNRPDLGLSDRHSARARSSRRASPAARRPGAARLRARLSRAPDQAVLIFRVSAHRSPKWVRSAIRLIDPSTPR